MIANRITISRILFSLLLLGFSPNTFPFAAFYLLCGVTDVLDGFAARKMHTESEKGALLDSTADLVFAVVYAVRILPWLNVPLWIGIWTSILAAAKITGILIACRKTHGFWIGHSIGNRLTGLFLFLLPMSVRAADVKYGVVLICITASFTVFQELFPGHGTKTEIKGSADTEKAKGKQRFR